MKSEITYLCACDRTIFRIGIPTEKEINKRTSPNCQQNLAVFSAAKYSENRIMQILHRKGQKKNGQNCHS